MRSHIVSDHCDDCGADLTGLASHLLGPAFWRLWRCQRERRWRPPRQQCRRSSYAVFRVSSAPEIETDRPATGVQTPQSSEFDAIHQLLIYLATFDYCTDVMEVCGGEAWTSRLASRRRLRGGENFGSVTSCDLDDESEQRAV
eukprot:6440775-Pyramimonas_sp.AAC.1